MATEMQNVNPTILNAADLPTRQRTKSAQHPGKNPYGDTIFSSDLSQTLLKDPFAIDSYSSSEPESDVDDDENVLEEPIDEQEIFGVSCRFSFSSSLS